jgi:uncharacterized ferredoxin-like protein
MNMLKERLRETVKHCLGIMEAAAITSPKGLGQNSLNTVILNDEELETVGRTMVEHGNETGQANYIRDGMNILQCHGLLLVGVKPHKPLGADCKACGYGCKDFGKTLSGDFTGPNCCFKLLDLGIALGSAARTASTLNLDSRVMFRPGVIAKRLGLIEGTVAIGIPVSISSKNIFFDR